MNRLVLIGNGFDLAHRLPTSYQHFINWYWDGRFNFLRKKFTAVSKEIDKNLNGLCRYEQLGNVAQHILTQGGYKNIAKSKYVNDKQITDHYAIIPTGQGLGNLSALDGVKKGVYDLIVRRFLSIFLPPAEYQKVAVKMDRNGEKFFASAKILSKPG